jgi:hypothetical protein
VATLRIAHTILQQAKFWEIFKEKFQQMDYNLLAKEIIRGLLMELEEICEEPIPPDLGEKASTSQLKRQYNKIKNMIKEMEDLEYEIKKKIWRTEKGIRKFNLPKVRKLEMQNSLAKFLTEFKVGKKLRDLGTKRREWLKQKESLEIRLEILPEILVEPNDKIRDKRKLNFLEGKVDSRQLISLDLENTYSSAYELEEKADLDINFDPAEEFAWEELAHQLENLPLVGSRDSLEKRIDKIKTKLEFREKLTIEFNEEEYMDNLNFGQEKDNSYNPDELENFVKVKEKDNKNNQNELETLEKIKENDSEVSKFELENFEDVKEKDNEINKNELEYLEKVNEIYRKTDMPNRKLRQSSAELMKPTNDFILKDFVGILDSTWNTAKDKIFRLLIFKTIDTKSISEIRPHATTNFDPNKLRTLIKLELKKIELQNLIKLIQNKRKWSNMKSLYWTRHGLLSNFEYFIILEKLCGFRTSPNLCRKLWHWKRKRVKKKFIERLDLETKLETIFFKEIFVDRRVSEGILFKESIAVRRFFVLAFFFKGSVADRRLLVLVFIFFKGSVADRQLLESFFSKGSVADRQLYTSKQKCANIGAERMEMDKSRNWLMREKGRNEWI